MVSRPRFGRATLTGAFPESHPLGPAVAEIDGRSSGRGANGGAKLSGPTPDRVVRTRTLDPF